MLSALAASLETTNDNVVFQLDPWDDLAAARAWMNLAGPQTLVLPRSQAISVAGPHPRGHRAPRPSTCRWGRCSDPRSLILFVWPTSSKWFWWTSGPVDVSDAFFRTVLQRNLGLLAAEPRVQRVLQQFSILVIFEARERQDALECMSDALMQYAQRFLGTDAEMSRPPADMMDRLLAASGRIRIRPMETERGMTHLDIGVQVEPDLQSPAGVAVLYDTITGQWHDQ